MNRSPEVGDFNSAPEEGPNLYPDDTRGMVVVTGSLAELCERSERLRGAGKFAVRAAGATAGSQEVISGDPVINLGEI